MHRAHEKKDRGKMMCMHLKLREERKKQKQQQQRHRRRRRVLSCGCLRFFWLIRWLFGFGAVSHSLSCFSLLCYNLSRARTHSDWNVRGKTKKTCPRNVSISVKLIFWNLCYTSIKLIPSHTYLHFFLSVPFLARWDRQCSILHGWALVCALLMKWR